jgi:hypothetical protein
MTTEELCKRLQSTKFNFSSEFELHLGIAQLLDSLNVHYQTEVVITPEDRIDFLLPEKIGIEVKVDGSAPEVTRQLWRYAQQESIAELILLTTRSKHKAIIGPINGKPIYVVHLLTFL